MTEAASYDVRHDPTARRFTVEWGGELSTAAYERSGGTITFTHTVVPTAVEGQGIATAMATTALDYARAEGLKVVPQCAFFAAFMAKNPEYEDLRAA